MSAGDGTSERQVVNSSAIADIVSLDARPTGNPLTGLFRRKTQASSINPPPEKYAQRVGGSDNASAFLADDEGYEGAYDLVRAQLETAWGTQGTEEQRLQFRAVLRELVASSDCMDIAAIAFLAAIPHDTLSHHERAQLTAHIKERMNDSGFHDSTPRLDEIYARFASDAHNFRDRQQSEEISVLDVPRFAYKWLHKGAPSSPPSAFHWDIPNINSTPVDTMSPPFEIHGAKCVIRFRRSYLLTNGETWTGVWLHNITSGRKVLDVKFALVLSNYAYPSVYQVEVIKPSKGLRPSQGVGVKLFAPLDRLVNCINGNAHPVIEANSIRVSVVSL
ncbi:hypothetical protein IWQ56_001318 [Coemansia nantahalensis]|uniref:Uncharacterized protein n=1 Tax=Coemansia nantahalensis TaxID=2789366 RepID=A0ACC1K3Z5_9FUNG|nr:hypothetical protein IWQ56_001318 [Coemansia nantahalensis]KAJ2773002.1 hypothetical protein IWQ57_001508 [Coemansia nantahalensis]